LKINGKVVKEGKSFRQGITLNENGNEKLIIWLKLDADTNTAFEISRQI